MSFALCDQNLDNFGLMGVDIVLRLEARCCRSCCTASTR